MIGIDSILTIGSQLIDRLWPNPADAEKAKLELLKLQQSGELAQLDAALKTDLGQMAINQAEAGSSSLFVAGWRPMVGWVCAAALAYSFVLLPMLKAILAALKPGVVLPVLDLADLWPLMFGMLGIGGMRSWEKAKGVAR